MEKGWCDPSDVGKEKSDHERWTLTELEDRRLPSYLLGTIKPPSAWNIVPVTTPPLDAQTQADIMSKLVEGSVSPKTQADFNKWAAANPHAYFPLLAKHNLARNLKEQPKALPKLDDLTDEDLATLSSAELKRILLNWAEVKTASELNKARGS